MPSPLAVPFPIALPTHAVFSGRSRADSAAVCTAQPHGLIRAATPKDAELLARTIRAAFSEYAGLLDPPSLALCETESSVRKVMARGGAFVAERRGRVMGGVLYACRGDHLYFSRLSVLPEFRGMGLARALTGVVEQQAMSYGLGCVRLSVRRVLHANRGLQSDMLLSRLTALVLLALTSSALAGGAGGSPAAPASAGCVPGFVQPSPAALGRELAAAQARWRAAGIRAYRFDFEQIAQPVRYPKTRVTVTAGRVSARPLEEGDASAFAGKASVEELFAFIRQGVAYARTTPCTELKVTYAPDGHPVSYASQLQTPGTANGVSDGGASWTVSGFRKR